MAANNYSVVDMTRLFSAFAAGSLRAAKFRQNRGPKASAAAL